MYRALWLIVMVLLATSCHGQTHAEIPSPTIVTSVRSTSVLFQPFTIIAVEKPQYARIHCADQEAQKIYRAMRDLSEMIFAGRMIQPGEYYGVSNFECVCEGDTSYEVELHVPVVVIRCKKSS